MRVIAYDLFPNKELDFLEYVSLDELLSSSDLISLHCPLTEETRHLINADSIEKMKDGVILVNTSRGGLIKTEDLIAGIRDHKFFAVGLDVYEEETDFVYEDMSERILQSSTIQRLLSFPNVTMTSHQGFFTEEALTNIAETTLKNATAFMNGDVLKTKSFLNCLFDGAASQERSPRSIKQPERQWQQEALFSDCRQKLPKYCPLRKDRRSIQCLLPAQKANIAVPPCGQYSAARLNTPGHIIPTDKPQMPHPTRENRGFGENTARR